ncbi:hypothetical protein IW140_001555 [Coemansia sp. RSA 1813]|nr:hypothetical protein EV178_001683 [Coemansia sp. RSA 1646]KAJ1765334.1 hypothetical protein LPJ74_006394 [Coemansia sp. RSA 1843]KAJ2091353.1 hypothetical protein IW138_002052 [Coemansia sp. RSA 986]KAJ2216544.1 hypothetical protein EV179_001339 [Coemansia sp. RSA 487]KAJ2571375.1 hypothetical protein IW140_001555 [Coemansia sp. RSA 1813]
MASAGSNANASAAQHFWDYFHGQKRLIDEKIAEREDVSQMVRDLDIALREALVYLPPYDQKTLSKDLESLRLAVQQKQQQQRRTADGKPRGKLGAGGGFKFKSAKTKPVSFAVKKTQGVPDIDNDSNQLLSLQPSNVSIVGVATSTDGIQTGGSSSNSPSSFAFTHISNGWKIVHEPQTAENDRDQTDCELRDISNSIVDLRHVSDSLRALNCHQLHNSIVICGPFAGSATIRDSTNCIVAVGVQQMRLENSAHIDTYLHCSSRPIIEKSSAIRFAPYSPLCSQHSSSSSAASDLLALPNMFNNVDDFNWLRRQHSPNWTINPLPLDSTEWAEFESDHSSTDPQPTTADIDNLLKFLPQNR